LENVNEIIVDSKMGGYEKKGVHLCCKKVHLCYKAQLTTENQHLTLNYFSQKQKKSSNKKGITSLQPP